MSKTYPINDKKSNQYLSICYKIKIISKANHNSNIKYVGSIINYRSFESIHYIINLDIISSFIIFRDFNYIFLWMYYYFKSIKLFLS